MSDSNEEKNDYSTVDIIAGAAISSVVSSVLGIPVVKAMGPDIMSLTSDTFHKKDKRQDAEEESMSEDFSRAFEDEK